MSKLLIKLATSKAKNRRDGLALLSGITGILCNIMLCVFKFIIGSISGSISITADAVNNLSDAAGGIVTIIGTKLSRKPGDREHPLGHGRIEYISALIISFFIFTMGFELAKSSVQKIINPQEIKFSIWYVIVLVCAVLVKLYMAFLNNKLYKLTDNVNLKAVKQDSLNDCITTLAALTALIISSLTSFKIADGIMGLLAAVFIFISGVRIVKDISSRIVGQAPDIEIVSRIHEIMLSEELITGVHDLIIHDYGAGTIIASAHAEVPSEASLVEVHDSIDKAENKIKDEMNILICIHIDPIEKK